VHSDKTTELLHLAAVVNALGVVLYSLLVACLFERFDAVSDVVIALLVGSPGSEIPLILFSLVKPFAVDRHIGITRVISSRKYAASVKQDVTGHTNKRRVGKGGKERDRAEIGHTLQNCVALALIEGRSRLVQR